MLVLEALGAGAGTAFLLTPLAMRLARRSGFVDQPQARKPHTAPTPLLGGVAVMIAAGVSAYLVAGILSVPGFLLLLAGALVALGVGLWDDRVGLGVAAKLAGQGAAAACVLASGAAPDLGLPAPLSSLVTWVALIGLMNAVNFLDNMNGMVGGLSAISLVAFAWGSFERGAAGLGASQLALAGACVGFLPYNFPRGRIFLGDAGSLLLGYSLGASAALAWTELPPGWGRIGVLYPLAYPVFDMMFVLVTRIREGRPVHEGGTDHSNHRLSTLLRCPKKTVFLIWAAGAALCASGLAIQRLNQTLPTLALSVLWVTTLWLLGRRLSSVPSPSRVTPAA